MSSLGVPVILICVLLAAVGLAIPKTDAHKNRAMNKPLSDKDHYSEQDEHNMDYDHDAILGDQDARTFDELTPEESRLRLGKIVDKMDKDSDGFVTLSELKLWIQNTQRRYILDDVERQWKAHNPDNAETLSWDNYKRTTYGFEDESENLSEDDGYSYKDMLRRDKRRWEAADVDDNKLLTKDEFTNFLHPEEVSHMRDVVVLETMEDIDKDKDGKVSLEEYIGDMYRGGPESEEPDWVRNEREQFAQYRDKNGDGSMDKDEVRAWIIPPDYDHAEAESKHLIFEADKNQDSQLSRQEILDKYDLFVGSQATDFGEALTRHDEF